MRRARWPRPMRCGWRTPCRSEPGRPVTPWSADSTDCSAGRRDAGTGREESLPLKLRSPSVVAGHIGQKGQELERAMIVSATRHSPVRAATMAAPIRLVPVVPSDAVLALALRLRPVAAVAELWRRLARD